MSYKFVRKAIVAVTCAVAVCCPAHAEESGKLVVKIGFVGALGTLRQGNLSFGARDGAQLAVDEANQRNIRIGGRAVEFELLVMDDQSDVNFARLAAHALVAAGVVGVIGHNTTDTSMAAAPIYHAAGLPLISPMSTGRQLTQAGYRNVFQLLGHSDITAIYLAQLSLQTIKAKRIAIVDNGLALGIGLRNAYLRQLKQDGGKVLFSESISSKTSDFNAVLSCVQREKADLLFFTGTGAQAVALSQNVQRLGVATPLLITGGAVNVEFPRVGPYPEGAYLLLHGLPVETRPGYAQFEKNYRKKSSSPLTAYAMFSYDAVGMLIEALGSKDSLYPQMAVETLHNMQYKGVSGLVSFRADGSQNDPPYSFYKAVERNWVLIKTYGG